MDAAHSDRKFRNCTSSLLLGTSQNDLQSCSGAHEPEKLLALSIRLGQGDTAVSIFKIVQTRANLPRNPPPDLS